MYDLPRITLGRTGLEVTRLGVGGAYCDNADTYRAALDCGVNYVDTARIYRDGKDEAVIGEAIAGRRDDLVIATKSDSRDAAGARRDLETSLHDLGTDHVDIWQIHYLNTAAEREQVLSPGGALSAALKARDEGLVRFIGVTGHVWPEIQAAVASGVFDTVLCWYNCAYKDAETTIFPEADIYGTGVVIMNASRNDKLFAPPEMPADEAPDEVDFYRYVLSHPQVGVTLVGLRDLDRFRRIAAGLAERETLSPEEMRALEAYGAARRAAGVLEMG